MPTDTSRYSSPKQLSSRQTDRRKASIVKRLPLIRGLGLLLNDRRSHRERRRHRRDVSRPAPCALLRQAGSRSPGGPLLGFGSWVKRCLTYPWRR